MSTTPLKARPRFLETKGFPKVMKYLSKGHVALYRGTGGRLGSRMPVSTTLILPVCVLTHTGRKSGKEFHTPLLFFADTDRVVLFAAQGGLPQDPQWYRNLKANPSCRIQVGSRDREFVARAANTEERVGLFPRMKKHYPGWGAYQSWCEREIPVVICEPAASLP